MNITGKNMRVSLREGEEVVVEAMEGTAMAYQVLVCYNNTILTASQARTLKDVDKED